MLEEIKKNQLNSQKPKLLLHSCCAPCSSYCIQFLSEYFHLEIFFFNPNIFPEEEYSRRLEEQKLLLEKMNLDYYVMGREHEAHLFYRVVEGYENMGEGSQRCRQCFYIRLEETAKSAKERGFDYFTTTLTISPLKNSQVLNNIGKELEEKYSVKYLYSDFKKNNGYKKSVDLSKEYELYRQDYCGCVFSRNERDEREKSKKEI